jgi:ketose-bisphosphate aldolase
MNAYIYQKSEQYFAFNIWNIESAKAVIDAAAQMKKNVILQTSTEAFVQINKEEMRLFVSNYAKNKGIQVYLHLDHCKKIDLIKEAINYKWDSVMIDGSELPLEENIRITNKVCDITREYEIPVEAEIGRIPRAEEGIQAMKTGVARLKDVQTFINATNVNMLAVAIGTSHGIYQGIPDLHYDLLERVMQIVEVPLVIHGGSGITDDMLRRLLSYKNVKKINISTDVKQAYRNGIYKSLQNGYLEKDGFDPLKVTHIIDDSIEHMVKEKLRILDKDKNRRVIE